MTSRDYEIRTVPEIRVNADKTGILYGDALKICRADHHAYQRFASEQWYDNEMLAGIHAVMRGQALIRGELKGLVI